ncbi:chromate transporter [Acidisoma cellulosilytica]|uniref:Chromate transporter n=1 Tax=Acidisoma cellulosilyticum TaxID=2802395 RepID=A0A963Z461_9PROT|nr:chromate transporter [Acidisoma cellulosilyticum]MCB8882131.1 chromate transporter [Acidisoma cellulosilyticum]
MEEPAHQFVTIKPSALQIGLIFSRIGLTSFGGGLSGWLLREFVQSRAWLTEEEFLNGLSLAQSLPGVNVTNMAIWIGYRLAGTKGAIAGLIGIILPPAVVLIAIAIAFASVDRYRIAHQLLDGAAAAAVGLSLSMGITAARRVPRRIFPAVAMATTFAAVAVMHWSLPWVVVIGGTTSIAVSYYQLSRSRTDA